MTTYHYRHLPTDQTITLEVPEGKEPPSHVCVPAWSNLGYDHYQLVLPPEPKPQWKFYVTWDNGQSTDFLVDEADVLFHIGELVRDRICKTFRVIKP